MAYRDEIDDAFDAAVFLEERFYEKGYQEGFHDGKIKGLQDGRQLGLLKGCEIGGEVGFYLGFVSLWLEIQLESPDAKPRCVKLLETVKDMLLSFPINDPTNEEMFAKLEKIRAKFRQVCSLLGVSVEYHGGGNVSGMSF
ncbi:unnamed protein product [Porites evermanni]|uniref:Essential protein Yae1 N-terminal domain-containing protein n=1 Tax=Porites evermanni TaxID=104178 RepID=A0ABN8LSJ9_9CNID|nr:unnamed protein product [Porites evermanni]